MKKYLVLGKFDAGTGVNLPGEIYCGPYAEQLVLSGCLRPIEEQDVTPTPEPVVVESPVPASQPAIESEAPKKTKRGKAKAKE